MVRVLLAATAALALMACQPKTETAADPAAAATETPTAEPAGPSPETPAPPPGAKAADAAAFAKYVPWKTDLPEIRKTGSGVEYVVLGSGPASGAAPNASQQAEVFYEGRLNIGGPAFDSAYERNESATFPVAAVVPGFSEALQLMKPGDHWLVYIPSALGYGARGAGGKIPPGADLVFEIEMVSVQ